MKEAFVIGFGLSGRSASHLLLKKGWKVTASDAKGNALLENSEVKTLLEKGVVLVDESRLDDISPFQLAILSPGIPMSHPLAQRFKEKNIPVIGEIELAFSFLEQPIIGITGTNGKTTVTLLASHVLNGSNIKACAVGNVGIPLAKEVACLLGDEILVTELSSYQLETLKERKLDAAAILNITPDHLDRYGSIEEYAKTKFLIQDRMKQGKKLVLFEDTAREFPGYFDRARTLIFGFSEDVDIYCNLESVFMKGEKLIDLPDSLKGKKTHDLENFIAAFALTHQFGVTKKQFLTLYNQFEKPHHRIEFVTSVNGVKFIDDSKGTNIDAVKRAVEAIEGPIHLIAGGVDKGFPYTIWKAPFSGKVKEVFAIGEAKEKIQRDLTGEIPVRVFSTLKEAVESAFRSAKPGETILLSPGCSSFDMFKDYVHRGNEFKSIAFNLKERTK